MNAPLVIVEKQDRIVTLTLNNPEQRNALSFALVEELFQAVESLKADPDLLAVVLTGAGNPALPGIPCPAIWGQICQKGPYNLPRSPRPCRKIQEGGELSVGLESNNRHRPSGSLHKALHPGPGPLSLSRWLDRQSIG